MPVKIRLNPLILGAFIVGAIVLAIVVFLAFGSSGIFQPSAHFVFYLPDSAQGMSAGSAIDLDGVRVGQVERVRVLYDRQTRKSYVGVICRISENLLTDFQGHRIKLTDRNVLKKMISEGLFVQVQTAGIVGAKYVELGFNTNSVPITPTGLPPSPYPVVPTVPSTMAELTDNLSSILSNLRQIDFKGIGQQINDVLISAREQIGALETNRVAANVSSAAQSLSTFMNSSDLHQAIAQLKVAASSLHAMVTNLNAQLQPLSTNLNTTLSSARQSVQTLQDFLKLRNQLGQQTQELMKQFDETARAIERLADFLEQHPNALITGRARQPESR